MFVGAERAAAVARLLVDWDTVRRTRRPRVAYLSAPLGWGKTRIVQEFYGELARSDPASYWPERIVAMDEIRDVSFLTRERKRLQPEPFAVSGEPTYIWLSVHADPSEFSRPEEAYRALAEQLEPHLHRILRRKRLTRAGAATVWKSLTAFVPIPADVSTYLDVGGAVKDFIDEWREGRAAERIVGVASTAEQAANFWKLLNTVWGAEGQDGPPIVIAIEDAQFLSSSSVELLRALLTSTLPVLAVVTGWPVRENPPSREEPFSSFVKGAPARVRVDTLDKLSEGELEDLVRAWHPGTPEASVQLLGSRTGGNPYALRLALIRLRAVRGAAVMASPDTIRRMPFDIHTQFESLLWAMSDPARLSLAATALIGYRMPRDVAAGGVATIPDGSLAGALATDWLRRDVVSDELVAFLEPLRHEVAERHGRDSFTDEEQRQILQSGLAVVRRLLYDDVADPDRALLYDLHVALALAGIESRLADALRSAQLLMTELRLRQARSTLREVIRRVDDLDTTLVDRQAVAEYLVVRARALRYCNLRADPATRRAAVEALAAVDALDPANPRADLRIAALAEAVRIARDIDLPEEYDLQKSRALLDEALGLVAAERITDTDLLHNIRMCEYGVVSAERDRPRATRLALEEAERAKAADGGLTVDSLEATSDAAWYAVRGGMVETSVQLSREVVRLRIAFWGSETHPRVASGNKDLAVRLIQLGRAHAQEAYALAGPAYRILETAFGPEDNATLNGLSARGYTGVHWGIRLEDHGERAAAIKLFQQGLADSSMVLNTRLRVWPSKRHQLTHERVCFARALNDDATAVDDLLELLRVRIENMKQPKTQAEVRWLARDTALAMRHLAMSTQASALVAEYGVADL